MISNRNVQHEDISFKSYLKTGDYKYITGKRLSSYNTLLMSKLKSFFYKKSLTAHIQKNKINPSRVDVVEEMLLNLTPTSSSISLPWRNPGFTS